MTLILFIFHPICLSFYENKIEMKFKACKICLKKVKMKLLSLKFTLLY